MQLFVLYFNFPMNRLKSSDPQLSLENYIKLIRLKNKKKFQINGQHFQNGSPDNIPQQKYK